MPKIQGVKIRSIVLAPGRESATIEMVNQTTKTITAFAYAYDITLIDGQHRKGVHMAERIGGMIGRENRLQLAPAAVGPLEPGEVHNEIFHFGEPEKVAGLAVTMEVLIYIDLTSESINQWVLDNFIAQRASEAEVASSVADAIAAAMQDEHPHQSAHDRLLKMKHSETDLRNLESGTFANVDEERKHLAWLLTYHRSYAATLAKHAKIAGGSHE